MSLAFLRPLGCALDSPLTLVAFALAALPLPRFSDAGFFVHSVPPRSGFSKLKSAIDKQMENYIERNMALLRGEDPDAEDEKPKTAEDLLYQTPAELAPAASVTRESELSGVSDIKVSDASHRRSGPAGMNLVAQLLTPVNDLFVGGGARHSASHTPGYTSYLSAALWSSITEGFVRKHQHDFIFLTNSHQGDAE